jgi:hypothetical protein
MGHLDAVAARYVGKGSLSRDEIVAYLRNLVFVIGEAEERGLAEFKRLWLGRNEDADARVDRAASLTRIVN